MARTPIPVAGSNKAGVDAPIREAADPVNGNTVANSDGRTILEVGNVGTVARTVAIRLTATVDGLPVGPRLVEVPPATRLLLGPYPQWWYGNALLLDPDHTDLRISAIRLGESLPIPAPAGPFAVSGAVVVTGTLGAGVTLEGAALAVDTVVTSSVLDGDTLIVTV